MLILNSNQIAEIKLNAFNNLTSLKTVYLGDHL